MIRGEKYVSVLFTSLFILSGSWLGFRLVRFEALAADYALTMGVVSSGQETTVQSTPDYFSDIDDFDEWQDMSDEEWEEHVAEVNEEYYGTSYSLASPSEASPSEIVMYSDSGPALLSSYNTVYEGGIGTTILSYFQGIVEKLPHDTHYVLFRQDRYYYRLVTSPELTYENGVFSAPVDGCEYVLYYSYDSTVSSGNEGDFSLDVGSYTVYSDLESPYPVLTQGVKNYEFKTLIYGVVVLFLFGVLRDIFKLCGYSYKQ